jgi:hypothetical protein
MGDSDAGGLAPTALSCGPPDWEHLDRDVLCPLCSYNMRGLAEPRCPECGCRYEWNELLNRDKWVHPYLFEHHPERKFRSFWKTILNGWRPVAFWTSVRPSHEPAPRRLILYWLLSFVPLLLVTIALAVAIAIVFKPNFGWRADVPSLPADAWNLWIDCLIFNSALRALTVFTFVMMLWPWLTMAALLVFQISMQKARIRGVHVLRCVIYSADIQLTIALLVLACTPLILSEPGGINQTFTPLDYALWVVCDAAYLFIIARLMIAYVLYLHFSHPVSVVLVSQVIAALLFSAFVIFGLGINIFEGVFFGLNNWLYRLHIP